jgi:hypothetical protein
MYGSFKFSHWRKRNYKSWYIRVCDLKSFVVFKILAHQVDQAILTHAKAPNSQQSIGTLVKDTNFDDSHFSYDSIATDEQIIVLNILAHFVKHRILQ